MDSGTVLVTGGAGFIGSHAVDQLVSEGEDVRVLDVLEPQVHRSTHGYRNPEAEYAEGSVLDHSALDEALRGVDRVVHLAAQVGVGQSMYEMFRYVQNNTLGTTVLLEALAARKDRIRSLVVASSMSIYGEGQYDCPRCGPQDDAPARPRSALEAREWDVRCSSCGSELVPQPTPETKRLRCDSVYAITKRDQEELSLVFGRAYGIKTTALRFFNVYGPRQSLSNPYTGIAAIFSSRVLNGQPPLIYEDGRQSRDFVHVSDISHAIVAALRSDQAGGLALNVGTGVATTVLEVARTIGRELGSDVEPEIVNRFRYGDIRHCYADVSLAQTVLGYRPRIRFGEGMRELVAWIREEAPPAEDRSDQATQELERHDLVL